MMDLLESKYDVKKTTEWEGKYVIRKFGEDDVFLECHDEINGNGPLCFATADLARSFMDTIVDAGGRIGSDEHCEFITNADMRVAVPTEYNFKKGDVFYEVFLREAS